MKIVDEQDGELPRGQVGEIIAKGPNMMIGYLNKPEATAEALKNGFALGIDDQRGHASEIVLKGQHKQLRLKSQIVAA